MALPSNFLGDLIAATQGGTVEPQQNAFGRIVSGLGSDPTQLPDLGPVQSRGMTAGLASRYFENHRFVGFVCFYAQISHTTSYV